MGKTIKHIRRSMLTVLLLAVLLLGMAVPVVAGPLSGSLPAEELDLNKKGSVKVTLEYEGKPVKDGEMALIQVADLLPENGGISFRYTDDFEGCTIELGDMSSPTLAKDLAAAVPAKAAWVKKNIGADGSIVFPELVPGLYLVRQSKASTGYKAADPFLVLVPTTDGTSWKYDVDSTPKLEISQEETTPPSGPPSNPPGRIPQTGQVNWPIPVLALAGLIMIVLGLVIRAGDKNRR